MTKITKTWCCLTATTQVYLESTEDEELHVASCTGTMVPLELAKCSQCDKAYSRKQVRPFQNKPALAICFALFLLPIWSRSATVRTLSLDKLVAWSSSIILFGCCENTRKYFRKVLSAELFKKHTSCCSVHSPGERPFVRFWILTFRLQYCWITGNICTKL
jgi:hypothetical protein